MLILKIQIKFKKIIMTCKLTLCRVMANIIINDLEAIK